MAFVSAASIIVTLLNTLIIAAVFVGIIALEVWLSRRKSRWPGLILPAVTLVLSLLMVLGFAAFSRVGATAEMQVIDQETGEIVYQEQTVETEPDWTLGDAAQLGVVLLVGNIPTFVLLGTYYIGREKLRREKMLEKMNIQDL
ncbi:MAG TPA: hypothetical protein H9936_02365 [Candidatus Agathobaculum intestinigallinarum]|nr:hypothetical protein [Candidatus Agathobaculum intestinigallinarum]